MNKVKMILTSPYFYLGGAMVFLGTALYIDDPAHQLPHILLKIVSFGMLIIYVVLRRARFLWVTSDSHCVKDVKNGERD